ncbi:MAG TPA: ComEC/Rec2 family competence protein [Solirubrobacterales bacterium]|nr:ComEC/Rec2 family competence protein [Solirubrobacterales bacterium]
MRRDRFPPLLLLLGVAAIVALAIAHDDEIRERAEAGLGRGMPPREAELARGFVLGQDDGIDRETVEDFRRAGLSHLLAVSGQNVALLALLAMPLLAAFGLPLRARLVWVLGLIVVYVPLTGAGPSIQRAAVMGALSLLATLGGRRTPRLYALLVAAIATLAVEPRIGADVGWQLSFAAVLGILLLGSYLRGAIVARIGSGGWRLTLAEGAAMTIAATLATAPLIAFHFGEVSTTTLFANLLALPAVAPAMWLGMLAAIGGQVPGFPVALVNSINSPLLAYVAQVAAWCGRPSWAQLQVRLDGTGLVLSYAALAIAVPLFMRLRLLRRFVAGLGLLLAVVVLAWAGTGGRTDAIGAPPGGLRVSVLDVGQGDAILLQPPGGDAILVDGGPAGSGLAAKLHAAGVDRLGAAVVTHDQSDHAGGIGELLGAMPIGNLLYAILDRRTLAAARAGGVPPRRIAAGSELRSARLRLEVLWPPPALLATARPPDDPNRAALVLLARWGDFSMLLAADAEAEATPLDPGPLDVLKVAHHGSDDAGLGDLLDRTGPSLAIVSVGEDNPFGHPTAATLAALGARGIRTLRTDRDGAVVLDVSHGSFGVHTAG